MRHQYPLVALSLLFVMATLACNGGPASISKPADSPQEQMEKMLSHQKVFTKRVETVCPGVHVAIGYALANSIMVEVDGGKVIVDTTESVSAATEIKAEFDRLHPGPIMAVIYTHTHPDHVLGTSVFLEPGTEVWAHEKSIAALNEQFTSLGTTLRYRGSKQFGEHLPEEKRISDGIGPRLRLDEGPVPPMVYPTHTFTGVKTLTFGGVTFELHEAPGETRDQTFVWLPDKQALLPGDNVYQAFPNLYSTRGVPPRPVRGWIASLDEMRSLAPEYLIPSHTGPVTGKEEIQELLTDYRDAIAYIHDSVIRMANEGKTPDDMVEEIHLPPHLANHPYLQEFYGKISWSVRGIYDGYLGWFDGNPSSLARLHSKKRAERLLPLLGGREKVYPEIENANTAGDHQWAAELADILLALDEADEQAKEQKAVALEALAETEINFNARNYLISSAMELRGASMVSGAPLFDSTTIAQVPVETLLSTLPERLDPHKTADVAMTIVYDFSDSKQKYAFFIRSGVGEISRNIPDEPDLTISITEADFKALLAGELNPALAIASGRLKADGGLRRLIAMNSYLIKP